MTFFEMLDTILLKSLELAFEIIYMMAYKITDNFGVSIIVLSLFMNFLVLPLYMRADAIQEEENAIEKKLQKGVAHIKKTFRGDERMMMLQTYYRQNNYKPIYVLRSALSLLLQIPFFIAAYRFLSGLEVLNGVAFGPISILGKPDGMLIIGGVTMNALPIIMTAVNLITCLIFTKGSSLKSKIQLYAMALFFLVFLYDSPAGLVLYWTINNVFSLVKTCFYKLKNPGKILSVLFFVSGMAVAVYGFFLRPLLTPRKVAFIVGVAVLMQIPIVWGLLKDRIKWKGTERKENRKIFLGGTAFLAVLIGVLIPSSVIKASPLEFIDVTYFYNPLWFIVSSFCLAFGIFAVWMSVFYFLAKPAVRSCFDGAVWILAGVFLTDYLFFGKELGLLTKELKYENRLEFTNASQLKNAVAVVVVALVLYLIYKYKEKRASETLIIGVLSLLCMAAANVAEVNTAVNDVKESGLEKYMEMPRFTLSTTGKNVVVFMLDRAVGKYMPYFLQEKPELKEKFDGFTYYANTISFGAHTNFGAPALFGGYEYTPVELNKRNEESLVQKQDEALKVMPVLFDRNGYEVTVCDPPYAGYQWIPDLSIYEEYPGIACYILQDKFTDAPAKEKRISRNKRNFFCYGILKAAPLCVQKTIYDDGRYNQTDREGETVDIAQLVTSMYTATGLTRTFMDEYNALCALPDMTEIEDEKSDTFLIMENGTTHELMMMQEPEYIPAMVVDNTEYERMNQWRYTVNGNTLRLTEPLHADYYQVNMAALLKVGEWFDYMRENNVYDNTRIILVADHGRGDGLYEEGAYMLGERDLDYFYPLLMVKDFGSRGFTISEEFMTNADVPTLAMKGLIENLKNPFTGKVIDSSKKMERVQYVIGSHEYDVEKNNGNTFLPSIWFSVHDDMRDVNNWKLLSEEETVLPPVERVGY